MQATPQKETPTGSTVGAQPSTQYPVIFVPREDPSGWRSKFASGNAEFRKYGSYHAPATGRQMRRILARQAANLAKKAGTS